jgi:hypothetical protein
MGHAETYFGFLDSIAGDAEAIEAEKQRLDQVIAQLCERIRKPLTPSTVPGLLWSLALKELVRIAPGVGNPVSNFAGHARFLRGLCAAVRFDSPEPSDDPTVDALLKLCDSLWSAMFHREMIEDPALIGVQDVDRRLHGITAMTSLLEAVQNDLCYIDDVERRVDRLFSPFSAEIIEPALGVNTTDIIKGFRAVWSAIPQRIEESQRLMQPAKDLHAEWEKRFQAGASEAELDRFVVDHPERDDISKKMMAGQRKLNQILLFRPDDLGNGLAERATAFLDAFAFVPGEVNLDLRTPYDADIVRRRPFAKIGSDMFVLVDPCYSSFSPPYRLLECFETERKIQRLNSRRDQSLEDEAAALFNSVVKADTLLRNYFLPVTTSGNLAERDLLLVKHNCIFVIESKARPLRSVKQRRDKLARIATDVRRSIQEGYDQACDVIRHIGTAHGLIPVFDSCGCQTAEFELSSNERFFPIVFLDSYYGLVATDLGPWLKVDEDIGFPWVVDRDTFASIILKVDSFEKLRGFLEWRRTLHGVAFSEDEAVFAGCFLTHGSFAIPEKAALVPLDASYADIFEAEYFRRKGIDVKIPPENIGPPVFSSIERVGDEITFKIKDKVKDVFNIKTGESRKPFSRKKSRSKDGKVGRNDPCPCGSGKKFKKCCMPLS